MFRKAYLKVSALMALGTASVMAAPVTIDTTEIQTSVGNVGGSAITLVLVIAGFYVAYRIIKALIK